MQLLFAWFAASLLQKSQLIHVGCWDVKTLCRIGVVLSPHGEKVLIIVMMMMMMMMMALTMRTMQC